MRRELLLFLVAAGLASTAGTLSAQTLGTPIFMAPTRAFQKQNWVVTSRIPAKG